MDNISANSILDPVSDGVATEHVDTESLLGALSDTELDYSMPNEDEWNSLTINTPEEQSVAPSTTPPPLEENGEDECMDSTANNPPEQIVPDATADSILYGSCIVPAQIQHSPTFPLMVLALELKLKLDNIVDFAMDSFKKQGNEESLNRKAWLRHHCTLDREFVSLVFRTIRNAEKRCALPEYVVCVFCNADRCHHSTACPHFPTLAERLANFVYRDMCFKCARTKDACSLEPCRRSLPCRRCKVEGHLAFLCPHIRSVTQDAENFERFQAAANAIGTQKSPVLVGGSRWFSILTRSPKGQRGEIAKVSPVATEKKKKTRPSQAKRQLWKRRATNQDELLNQDQAKGSRQPSQEYKGTQ